MTAVALMATALVIDAGRIVSTMRTMSAPMPAAPKRGLFPMLGRPPDGRLKAIVAAHLFGRPVVDPVDAPAEMASGQFVLTGTVAVAGRAEEGFAILRGSKQDSHLYRVGASIGPGTTLGEIYPDHIILLVNGSRQILRMPKPPRALARRVMPAPANPPAEVADADTAVAEAVRPPPGPSLPATPAAAVLRSLHLQRDTLPEGGVGMRIAGDNTKALAALGLSPGDVVVQVNGSPVGEPIPGQPNLVQLLHSGQPTNLMVERHGRIDQVTIDQSSAAAALQAYQNPTSVPD